MSIKTGIAALALATLAVTGSIASTTQAEAKGLGWGIGPMATTWAAFAPAITDDRLDGFSFDAFSSREPASTPDRVRGRLSLENALIVDPASGTGASSTPVPHPTRPAVPPGRVIFFSFFESRTSPSGERCCMRVTWRCHSTASFGTFLLLRISCNKSSN